MNDASSSALSPAGPVASVIADNWWFMFTVCGIVFIIVMFLLVLALVGRRKHGQPKPPLGDTGFIVAGGIVLPVVVLSTFLGNTLKDTAALTVPETSLTIEVTGYMWWWDVRYPDLDIITANELYIPVGEPVRIELRSADVIHSFWVPSLSGKTDLIPGMTTVHWLAADEPGQFRGQCAEFCGLQHARMAFYVVALSSDDFDAWVQARRQPREAPTAPQLRAGLDVFLNAGCAECHAIKGTGASGVVGPDLTHIGSRLSLGAATLPFNHGNLAGWIANPQPFKPGNKMPATYLGSKQLDALTLYLRSLR